MQGLEVLPAAAALAATPDAARVLAEPEQPAEPELTIPPTVASLLGREGCLELWELVARHDITDQKCMLEIAMPTLVRKLLIDRVFAAEATMAIEAENDKLKESSSSKIVECSELEDALYSLHSELKLAKAKIESLHRVIRDMASVNRGQ